MPFGKVDWKSTLITIIRSVVVFLEHRIYTRQPLSNLLARDSNVVSKSCFPTPLAKANRGIALSVLPLLSVFAEFLRPEIGLWSISLSHTSAVLASIGVCLRMTVRTHETQVRKPIVI